MAAVRRVAYLGPPGTNTEVAALRYYPAAERVPYPTIAQAARAVEAGDDDRAMAPIENSLQGTITDTVDLLIRDDGLAICGEIVLEIEHCLMVQPGADRRAIDVICSRSASVASTSRPTSPAFVPRPPFPTPKPSL